MPKFRLELTYEESLVEHDGYCSDPGEITNRIKTYVENQPINRSLYKPYLSDDGSVDLVYFDHDRTTGCKNGSGYCGGSGYIKLLRARVCKNTMHELAAEFE